VYHENEYFTTFDPVEYGNPTIQEVVDWLSWDRDAPIEEGVFRVDLAIWQGGRLRAVILVGDDGGPRPHIFG
jgi:hypothetical protein